MKRQRVSPQAYTQRLGVAQTQVGTFPTRETESDPRGPRGRRGPTAYAEAHEERLRRQLATEDSGHINREIDVEHARIDDPHFDLLRDLVRDITGSVVVTRGLGGAVVRAEYVGLPRAARPNGLGEQNPITPLIHTSQSMPTPEHTTGTPPAPFL